MSSGKEQGTEAEVAAAMMGLRTCIPKDKNEAELAEKALAQEMDKLSVHEREKIMTDLHSSRDNDIEESELAAKLQDLQLEMSFIADKSAYQRALSLNESYVKDEALRFLFLKAEEFNPKNAAKLLAFHFQVKRELFVGESDNDEILVRNITWEDLEEHDRRIVLSGFFQVGSKRDDSGRTVMYLAPVALQPNMIPASMCRAFWYVLMSALLSDKQMQQKGVVFISTNFGNTVLPLDSLRAMTRVNASLPFVTAAVHYCYSNSSLRPAVVGFRMLLHANNPKQSYRFRFHHGTMDKIAAELQTYGIPMDNSPVQSLYSTGSIGVSLAWHLEWLQTMQKLEGQEREKAKKRREDQAKGTDGSLSSENGLSDTRCIIPRRFDVLFGKTKEAREHTGTLRCHHLVRMHWDDYEQASRRDKTKVADQILAIIRDSNGRFLRWERTSSKSGYWVIVDHEGARDKISHMFRHLRAGEKGKDGTTGTEGVENPHETATVISASSVSVTDAGNTAVQKTLHSFTPDSVQPRLKQRRLLAHGNSL